MAKKKTPETVADLIPDNKNFNLGNSYGESLIEKSFSKFGAGRSILLDKNNRIIAGNKSTQKFAEGGGEKIIVVETDGSTLVAVKRTDIDLDTPQGREMALADNMAASKNITIEAELVTAELTEAVAIEWGVETGTKLEAEEDDFDVPEGGIETDIVLGDLFEIGQHRLLCGDSTKVSDIEKLMDGNKVDLIFTDPPYSVNFTKKSKEVLKSKNYNEIANDNMSVKDTSELLWKPYFKNAYDIAKDDCSIYCTMPQGGDQMMMMMSENWQVKHELIWVKEAPVFSMGRLDYDYKHEPIAYGWKNKHNFYGKGEYTKSVWEIARTENKLHPTMKPVRLIANAILNSTKENDIVFDGFGGSGSTMCASEQTKRKSFLCELDPKYCQVIVDRMLKLDPTLVIKKNGVLLETKVAA